MKKMFAAVALLLGTLTFSPAGHAADPALERGEGVRLGPIPVRNVNRTVGTMLGNAVAAQMLAIQQVPKRLAPTGASVEVDAADVRPVEDREIVHARAVG